MSLLQHLLIEMSSGKEKAIKLKIANHIYGNTGRKLFLKELINIIKNNNPEINKNISKVLENNRYVTNIFDNVNDIDFISENASKFYKEFSMALLTVEMVFRTLEEQDPTPNGKYINWLLDVYFMSHFSQGAFGTHGEDIQELYVNMFGQYRKLNVYGSNYMEDRQSMHGYLKAFDTFKKRNLLPDEYRDINNIDGSENRQGVKNHLYDVIYPIYKEINKFKGDVFELIETDLIEDEDYTDYSVHNKYHVYEPLTQKAKSYMGANTEWCTTYGEHCLNNDYKSRTPMEYDNLYILINKYDHKEKYQFHFETEQFRDAKDSLIDLNKFFIKNEEVYELFKDIEGDDKIMQGLIGELG